MTETSELKEREPEGTVRLSRRKRRWYHRLLFAVVLVFLFAAGLFIWISSASFENRVRLRLIAALEAATGGRVEIESFHWQPLHLRVETTNITIHGLEGISEAPYAHVDLLRVRISILHLFSLRTPIHIVLREAQIERPEFHLIVYPDGTTNQPHLRQPHPLSQPVMQTLFDARIGKLIVDNGSLHIANEIVPLDLAANDANIQMSWVPGHHRLAASLSKPIVTDPASYRIGISLGSLAFAQGKQHPIASHLNTSINLYRDGLQLDSLRLTALDRSLVLRGELSSFAHPVWKAQLDGQFDLRMLAPYVGLSFTRSGVVTLSASVSGQGSRFESNGQLTSDAIHYQDPVVNAQTAAFSARFRADTKQLLVSGIHTKLLQGGAADGEFQFDNWLATTPKPATAAALRKAHETWLIPVGKVRAQLSGVSLDTILAMLAAPAYRHLGFDTVVSGPATAEWTGLADDLAIGGQVTLAPSAKALQGEAPVNGTIDATYHKNSGSVDVRSLDARLPHSSIEGKGMLGVHPIDRVSEINLDFASSDLSEFDSALRVLNVKQGSRVGAAALPVMLKGSGSFHGQLNSSWLTPRLEGRVNADHISIELPTPLPNPSSPPVPMSLPDVGAPVRSIAFDSIAADGLYSPARIEIHHGRLQRGSSILNIEGYIASADPDYNLGKRTAEFGPSSEISVKAQGQDLSLAELLTLAGGQVPGGIDGMLNAQVSIDGRLNAVTGSGTVDVVKATLYGESIDQVHATGSVAGHHVKITGLTARKSSGQLTGAGSYDMASSAFQVEAHGTAIDLGSIQALRQSGVAIAGKASLNLTGAGTIKDPHLEGHTTLSELLVAGKPVADVVISANTSQRAGNALLHYDLSSRQPAGQLRVQGDTSLNADYTTEASLEVSKVEIGALLKLLNVHGITGQSDIEGKATIAGPLAHLERLHGEATLKQIALVVQGVPLQSKGPLHASLSDGLAHLDPLEITGESTDATLRGTLAIAGNRQLDLVANGSVNLRLAESIDPDLVASGSTAFQVEAHGPVTSPVLQGKVEFQNAGLALQDFPNGLSQIKGTLEFVQNRLEIRSLTAISGGGQLSVSGYLGFQRGLYADLTANCKSIRVRYPQGVSSLADAKLRLQGPQNNLLLSGNVLVTRFAINADLDMAAFASQSVNLQSITAPDAPSNHIRLDVNLTSAPQLNFQNAYAKLAGDVDLHLRGTLASPSLLGRISLTEGSTTLAGTKYELQRGDIYFSNPVRIQPNIDLDATARVEDYDITLGLHGTSDKLNVTYRSEPPLPEADVIALLALGRTQSEQTTYAQQQQQAGDNPSTDALLGGALNATVSNRVQKLFGSGAVKIDPNFIGSLGNSTARVTVVEQIGKNLTFTYASNVNTTTQQLIQAEIAINRHVSLLLTQDESGIFSAVVKARRRFR